MRIPVQIEVRNNPNSGGGASLESTIIEFGTAREVLFSCSTHLEFGDIVYLCNVDGSLDTEASIVAVQYQQGQTLVAARFLNPVPNWIVKS